ncbi:zinc finger BED domain-containing protein RICESLEEPER 2-like [Nicotiana tabacum]|uniref:Zinc finger BED domain-containing protein RICESLEEPER 2-like n=1 Tax=Nicotiana tabacum TaxID=4097 RepID=A0AC58U2X2_TOBAC
MESQGEQNPMCSSSSTTPIEIESRGLMQSDQVNMEVIDETGKRKLSFDAWKHYKVVKLDGAHFGVCKYCNTHIKSTRKCGTSSLWDHIRRCRKKPSNLEDGGGLGGDDGIQQHYFDQDISCRKLAHAIILYEYPLSIVDHVGFRKFVASLQPLFKIVSRSTINNDILKIFDNLKSKTSKLLEKLTKWNLERRISTITVDNSSTNNAMMKILLDEKLCKRDLLLMGRMLHVRCAAHILNLIVQEGIKVIEDGISNVRNNVLYWIASSGRIERFEEAARLLHISCTKKLEYDCPTRSNSTYLMLRTTLDYKEVFRKLSLTDTNYRCFPTEGQWSAAHEVCEKLQLFHHITEQFSGSQYPTSTQYFSKVCDIKLELEAWVKNLNPLISSMALSMLLKFKKYWDDMHISMGVATIFDSRFKMKVVASHESFQASSSNEVAGVVEGDRRSSFDRFVASSRANVDPRSELESYLEEARDLLAIPVSNIASESAFSTSGRLINPHHSRLYPTTLEALMCARTWLWNEINGSYSSIDRVSCLTMLDEEEDPDVSVA